MRELVMFVASIALVVGLFVGHWIGSSAARSEKSSLDPEVSKMLEMLKLTTSNLNKCLDREEGVVRK